MRKLLRDRGLRSTALTFVGSLALLSLTLICYRLRLNLATAVLLFLIVVVLLSLAGDFVSSIVASVVAALCLEHLAPPIGFRIADPLDVLAVAAFFITSLAIIILLHKMRKVADDALKRVRRQLVETEERQRRRIAGDLYDDVCQQLTLMAVQLQEPNHGDLEVLREELRNKILKIATDTQALAHELHFAKLEYLGMAVSMRSFCREFSERWKVEIDFRYNDLQSPVPLHIATCLFRILQEALHNSAKHSGVRHFEVELRGESDAIHLTVHDSGLGFDPKEKLKSDGLGLVTMRERLSLVDGTLSIDSEVKAGTTIHACVPFSSATSSLLAISQSA